MTADQREMITQLSKCVFLPGSFDKDFVRDMADYPDDRPLSPRQEAFLQNTYHRFRKQIGLQRHKALCVICNPNLVETCKVDMPEAIVAGGIQA